MSRPRFVLDLFALAPPLVNAMQFDAEARLDVLGATKQLRPGRITTDANLIARAIAAGVRYHIPGPIVIGALVAPGAFAAGQITIAGVIHIGDTINVTINGHALAAGYVVATGDTFAGIAEGVARLIADDATDAGIVSVSTQGLVINVVALTAGATGAYTLTTAVTGGSNTTTATASGAALGGSGTVVVQGQEVSFTPGQVISDPTMIGVVAQNQIPYTLQAGVEGYSGF